MVDGSNKSLVPIILSGGSGTRLWPLSRYCFPKQFVSLSSDSKFSLLQQTLKRIQSFDDVNDPIIICNEEHRFVVAEQCQKIEIKPKEIILEPFGRNTSAAILSAALRVSEENQEKNLLILSSDHLMKNIPQFKSAVDKAKIYSNKGKIVLFGVLPYQPETGYGYIEVNKKPDLEDLEPKNISKFIEKPKLEDATEFLKKGNYLWNSGIFMMKTSIIINEMKKYEPQIYKDVYASYRNKIKDLDFVRLERENYKRCESISIDKAIMEKTNLGVVFPLDKGWSDVGTWFSLWQNSKQDADNNVKQGRVFSEKNKNCYLRSDNRLLVALGLENLVVIETDDVVYVGDIKKSQDLKHIVNKLKMSKEPESESHSKVFRPWGNYKSMIQGERFQVKIIRVKPGASLSLQMHHHRSEHWIVVKGTADVELEEKKILLSENQSIHIPLGSKHRLSNPGKLTLELIEVQSGAYLNEDDIVRYSDFYGR